MKSIITYINESKYSRKKELEKWLKGRHYEDYVKVLDEMIDDPKAKALLDDAFGGSLGNTQLRFKGESLSANRLMPTQNEICLDVSLKYGLQKPERVKEYFEDDVEIKHPVVTFNESYVVDGHHRWAEIYIFNPNAKMVCANYDGDMSPIQMLKVTQGAIAADPSIEDLPVSKPRGMNLYDMSNREIRSYIDKNMSNDIANELIKYVEGLEDREDALEYLTDNAISLKVDHEPITNAPNREIMPQTSKSKGKNDQSEAALKRMENDKVYKM